MPQAGRRCDAGPGAHDVDDGLDEGARREVLPGPGLDVLGVALQQGLVGVALDVGAEGQPGLAVDQLLDEPGEHGRLLNPVLGLAEYDAEGAWLPGQRLQRAAVVGLELVAVTGEQAGPVESLGDGRRPVAGQQRVRRLAALVHHLQEDEVGELLQVVAVGEPGVPEDVAVVPELLADGGGTWSCVLRCPAGFPQKCRIFMHLSFSVSGRCPDCRKNGARLRRACL